MLNEPSYQTSTPLYKLVRFDIPLKEKERTEGNIRWILL